MSDKASWSDSKRWFMGIVSALIMLAVGGAGKAYMDRAAEAEAIEAEHEERLAKAGLMRIQVTGRLSYWERFLFWFSDEEEYGGNEESFADSEETMEESTTLKQEAGVLKMLPVPLPVTELEDLSNGERYLPSTLEHSFDRPFWVALIKETDELDKTGYFYTQRICENKVDVSQECYSPELGEHPYCILDKCYKHRRSCLTALSKIKSKNSRGQYSCDEGLYGIENVLSFF